MAAQSASAVAITGGTITGITDLAVADGGTGASTITANSVILGNGASALSGNLVAPSTSGNVLTSDGTTWTSATPAGGIGISQTWQNVTGSRALGTTYTNSSGKPIQVHVQGSGAPSGAVLKAYINGTYFADSGVDFCASIVSRPQFSLIIPNGVTYRFDSFTSGGTNATSLNTWWELR
jgi:hypothetical protein